jgi:hypothetical protein
MDWFREHLLQILIAVAAAIAAWLNNRKRERDGESADYDDDGVPENRPRADMRPGQHPFEPSTMEMGEADRTRRLQEEIRRKIAERRGQPVPPVVAPRPTAQPIPEVIRRYLEPETASQPSPAERAAKLAAAREREAELERQRALEEKMRELEAQRAEARRRATEAAFSPTTALAPGASSALSGAALLADLRQPGSARRALILREVLGAPAGLR